MDWDVEREELLTLGRECVEDPTCRDMSRQGRPLRNEEMMAICLYGEVQRRKADEFLKGEL